MLALSAASGITGCKDAITGAPDGGSTSGAAGDGGEGGAAPGSSSGNAVGAGAAAGAGGSGTVTLPPPACSAKEGQPVTLTSQAQFETLFEGRWLFCDGDGPVGPSNDQVGLDILPDRTFFVLHLVDNKIVRGTGFDYQGNWIVYDPQSPSAVFSFADGWFAAGEAFEDKPRKMRIDSMSGVADYVPAQ
jgi:hypothetical protein